MQPYSKEIGEGQGVRVSGWSSGGGLRGGGDESDTNPKAAESKGNGSPTSPATDEPSDGSDGSSEEDNLVRHSTPKVPALRAVLGHQDDDTIPQEEYNLLTSTKHHMTS